MLRTRTTRLLPIAFCSLIMLQAQSSWAGGGGGPKSLPVYIKVVGDLSGREIKVSVQPQGYAKDVLSFDRPGAKISEIQVRRTGATLDATLELINNEFSDVRCVFIGQNADSPTQSQKINLIENTADHPALVGCRNVALVPSVGGGIVQNELEGGKVLILQPEIFADTRPMPTTVFVGGFTTEVGYYRDLYTKLAKSGQRVIAYDLLGQGKNRVPGSNFNYTPGERADFTAYVAQLDSVIKKYVVPGSALTLMGHSLGGAISILYAARPTSLPARLVLASPYTTFPIDLNSAGRIPISTTGTRFKKLELHFWKTMNDLAARVRTSPGLAKLPFNSENLAKAIAPRLYVHWCVRVLFGTVCGDRWVSQPSQKIEPFLRGIESINRVGGTLTGGTMPLLAIANLIQVHHLINDGDVTINGLKRHEVFTMNSTNRDPITPLRFFQRFAERGVRAGGLILNETVPFADVEAFAKVFPIPSIAGHDSWRIPSVQDQLVEMSTR